MKRDFDRSTSIEDDQWRQLAVEASNEFFFPKRTKAGGEKVVRS